MGQRGPSRRRGSAYFGAAQRASAQTQRDNYVAFPEGCATAFNNQQAHVSSGQPYGGTSVQGCRILVKAGRHKTSQVANVFNNECNPNQQSTFGHTAGVN